MLSLFSKKFIYFISLLSFGLFTFSSRAENLSLGVEAGMGISDSIKAPYPTGNDSFHPPGFQGALGISLKQDHVIESPSFLKTRIGTHLQIDALFGRPYFRTVLSFESPGFWLAGKWESSSKEQPSTFHGLFFFPFTVRGIFTVYDKQPNGDQNSVISNSYGLGSIRIGYLGKLEHFIFGVTSGLEGGYIKAQAAQAPFAGFVIGPHAEFSGQLTEKHGIGFRIETDIHLNVLRALRATKHAQHGFTLAGDLHYIYRNKLELGIKTQLSLLSITSVGQAIPEETPSFYLGPFVRLLI